MTNLEPCLSCQYEHVSCIAYPCVVCTINDIPRINKFELREELKNES